jgi:predicted nucleotidyltransferase
MKKGEKGKRGRGEGGREEMETVSIDEQEYGKLIPAETVAAVVRAIAERFSPERIILFGSYASSRPTPDSDLDLLVIMPSDLPPYKRSVPLRLLFRPAPCALDVLVYTPEEVERWNGTVNHIITEALRSGRVVYERE